MRYMRPIGVWMRKSCSRRPDIYRRPVLCSETRAITYMCTVAEESSMPRAVLPPRKK